jgi:hypothetical protein
MSTPTQKQGSTRQRIQPNVLLSTTTQQPYPTTPIQESHILKTETIHPQSLHRTSILPGIPASSQQVVFPLYCNNRLLEGVTQDVSQFLSKWIQITKLCNNLLSTARWANRNDKLTTGHCLHCGEPEDWDHLIRCTHKTSQKWCSELLTNLRQAHNSPATNPYLLNSIIDGIHPWLTCTQIDPT